MFKLNDIQLNPDNPRTIREDKYKKLLESLKRDPKFLITHRIAYKNGVIFGGNMRYRALLELGYKEVPDDWVVDISTWNDDEVRRYVVIDNIEFGDIDWDKLSTDYEVEELLNWGYSEWDLKLDNKVDYNKTWEGMPEFGVNTTNGGFQTILIHFEKKDDVEKFAKLVGQSITDDTKYLWFPRKEKENIKAIEIKSEDE